MPPKSKLSAEQITALTEWVRMGAPWPEDEPAGQAKRTLADIRQQHWSFRPVQKPEVPTVKNVDRVATPVDAFVLAPLEAQGLLLSPDADRPTLMRRVWLDLVGVPPSPASAAEFLSDESPQAYEQLIDRLLETDDYAKHWALYWQERKA